MSVFAIKITIVFLLLKGEYFKPGCLYLQMIDIVFFWNNRTNLNFEKIFFSWAAEKNRPSKTQVLHFFWRGRKSKKIWVPNPGVFFGRIRTNWEKSGVFPKILWVLKIENQRFWFRAVWYFSAIKKSRPIIPMRMQGWAKKICKPSRQTLNLKKESRKLLARGEWGTYLLGHNYLPHHSNFPEICCQLPGGLELPRVFCFQGVELILFKRLPTHHSTYQKRNVYTIYMA